MALNYIIKINTLSNRTMLIIRPPTLAPLLSRVRAVLRKRKTQQNQYTKTQIRVYENANIDFQKRKFRFTKTQVNQ
jgi:DNA-binding response OmpR family regulator